MYIYTKKGEQVNERKQVAKATEQTYLLQDPRRFDASLSIFPRPKQTAESHTLITPLHFPPLQAPPLQVPRSSNLKNLARFSCAHSDVTHFRFPLLGSPSSGSPSSVSPSSASPSSSSVSYTCPSFRPQTALILKYAWCLPERISRRRWAMYTRISSLVQPAMTLAMKSTYPSISDSSANWPHVPISFNFLSRGQLPTGACVGQSQRWVGHDLLAEDTQVRHM